MDTCTLRIWQAHKINEREAKVETKKKLMCEVNQKKLAENRNVSSIVTDFVMILAANSFQVWLCTEVKGSGF